MSDKWQRSDAHLNTVAGALTDLLKSSQNSQIWCLGHQLRWWCTLPQSMTQRIVPVVGGDKSAASSLSSIAQATPRSQAPLSGTRGEPMRSGVEHLGHCGHHQRLVERNHERNEHRATEQLIIHTKAFRTAFHGAQEQPAAEYSVNYVNSASTAPRPIFDCSHFSRPGSDCGLQEAVYRLPRNVSGAGQIASPDKFC